MEPSKTNEQSLPQTGHKVTDKTNRWCLSVKTEDKLNSYRDECTI